MAPHSSTLAWTIPWTQDPGRLQSMESHRVGQDWSDLTRAAVEHLFMCLGMLSVPRQEKRCRQLHLPDLWQDPAGPGPPQQLHTAGRAEFTRDPLTSPGSMQLTTASQNTQVSCSQSLSKSATCASITKFHRENKYFYIVQLFLPSLPLFTISL